MVRSAECVHGGGMISVALSRADVQVGLQVVVGHAVGSSADGVGHEHAERAVFFHVPFIDHVISVGVIFHRDLHYRAALKLLANKRQHVRADGGRMLAGMPIEDFHRVGDRLLHVIKDQDPTYHSYHSPGGPVASAIAVFADLNIEEGLDLALGIEKMESGKHSFKLKATWASLAKYGANAKDALEVLRERYEGRTDFGRHTGAYNAMVKAIEEDKAPRRLISFEEAKRRGRALGAAEVREDR